MSNSNKPFIDPVTWFDFLSDDTESNDFSFNINADDIKKYCEHKWVEVGFMHSKIVCKTCDIEKKDWDKYQTEQKFKEETDSFRWR